MEDRTLLVIMTAALATAGIVGASVSWRQILAPARSAFLARAAADGAAQGGLTHAIACLNRAWPSPECGGTFGAGYAGQTDVVYEDGSRVDIAVEEVATATRLIRTVGHAPDPDVPAAAYRAEARNDGAADPERPALVEAGAFGWKLVPGKTIEFR